MSSATIILGGLSGCLKQNGRKEVGLWIENGTADKHRVVVEISKRDSNEVIKRDIYTVAGNSEIRRGSYVDAGSYTVEADVEEIGTRKAPWKMHGCPENKIHIRFTADSISIRATCYDD